MERHRKEKNWTINSTTTSTGTSQGDCTMTRRKVTKQLHRTAATWQPLKPIEMTEADREHFRYNGGEYPVDNPMQIWANTTYLAAVELLPQQENGTRMAHMMVKRHDLRPIGGWDDLQKIKTEIFGPEQEAIELYPAEDRLFDEGNIRHLWVVKDLRWPLGYNLGRRVTAPGNGRRTDKKMAP
jgi:hypothetical protein